MSKTAGAVRMEKDSLGELAVPAEAYWGVQTQRAISNFPISGTPMPRAFIRAHVMLKKAAALVNMELGLLEKRVGDAIVAACDEVIADEAGTGWSGGQFPVDVYQTGSGTSTNMNVNEVVASRANEMLGGKRGDKSPVHPNDHVNLGQSSNDTVPTSMQVIAAGMMRLALQSAARALAGSLDSKSQQFWNVIKTGRTHLQDATPVRLGQEFKGYALQIAGWNEECNEPAIYSLSSLPLGGTAVGTGINAHPQFAGRVISLLSEWTQVSFEETGNHFGAQAALDAAVTAHAALKSLAVVLTKICNDIRWMGSGPRAGLGEIELPAVQPGSSIMPGKVNPVICESVLMVCQRVIGNDAAMTAAACGNNFELAMSMPLAAHLLHESITLLANACRNLATQCVDGLKATERGPELVEKGLMLATALAPVIGYDAAAAIAKEAAESGRTIREVAREKTDLSEEQLRELLDPAKMTEPGGHVGPGGG